MPSGVNAVAKFSFIYREYESKAEFFIRNDSLEMKKDVNNDIEEDEGSSAGNEDTEGIVPKREFQISSNSQNQYYN